jgi:hypothetical protein
MQLTPYAAPTQPDAVPREVATLSLLGTSGRYILVKIELIPLRIEILSQFPSSQPDIVSLLHSLKRP